VGIQFLEGRPVKNNEPIFTPHDFLNYVAAVRGVGVEAFQIPSSMIIVYQQRHFDLVDRLIEGKPVEWWWYGDRLRMHVGSFNGVEIVVATNFVGSPAAAMVFKELIACGAKRVFEVGLSGGLQSFLKPGDIVVATEAICDESTTCQYLHDHKSLFPSHSLKRLLVEVASKT
jgi:hypothetical protein